ncbi:ROK family protein [Aliagarivorans marinus]|uniref:ROK family protein n=1 Tax=Aliagarivorans marinus TaxID=561965 RepID=UPI00042592CA|nr:ROK family protein [Aliagarivorans marinus]
MVSPKTDTEQIRRENRRLLVETLRHQGPLARVELGAITSLSPATVTAITSELVAQGHLQELSSSEEPSGRGRPRVALSLVADSAHYIGIKISINEIRLMLGNYAGEVTKQFSVQLNTSALSPQQLVHELSGEVQRFIDKHHLQMAELKGIGLAVQGVVDQQHGGILWSPAFRQAQPGLAEALSQRFNLPALIANDADCLALALHTQPRYRDTKDLIAIQLGYGVGMGLIQNGQLYLGSRGAIAEFGHTKVSLDGPLCRCGARGCLEAYLGDYALLRDASAFVTLPPGDPMHPSEEQMQYIQKQASLGNENILHIYQQAGRMLGLGLSNLMALYNPEKIVISGPGVRAAPLSQDPIQEALQESLLPYLRDTDCVETHHWNEDLTGKGIIAMLQKMSD